MSVPGSVIISRPDALGDSVVTFTTAGWLKHHAPHTRITVIAKEYTRAAWERCTHVDRVITLEELRHAGESGAAELLAGVKADAIVHVFPHRDVARWAKAAGIPRRIGTSHRWWHWTTCNERLAFSRKRSDLHEAQLNIKLLEPFGLPMPAAITDLVHRVGYAVLAPSQRVSELIRPDRMNVLLHPLHGTGAGWGLKNYAELIGLLDPDRYHCIITGTARESEAYRSHLPLALPHVTDTGGQLDLTELMGLIGATHALVSGSTGPLHLAAASGIRTIGLYNMRRPLHPGRWAPIGADTHVLVNDPHCARCASGKPCDCIGRINPRRVIGLLDR